MIRVPSLARVPQAPKALLGVANLRGEVLAIVSVRALLGLESGAQDAAARVIVLDDGSHSAVEVDSVEALVIVDSKAIQTRPAELGAEPAERLQGAFALDGGRSAAKILDIDAMLGAAFTRRVRPAPTAGAHSAPSATASSARPAPREAFVTFDVAGQEFALPLGMVEEVVPLPESVTAVPRADAATLGMIPFRDLLLPLVSLRALLGFPAAARLEQRAKIVIASVHGAPVGLVVDRAHAVVAVDPADIEPAPAALVARMAGESRLSAIYRADEGRRLISILAPDRLFREDVMQKLEAAGAAPRPKAANGASVEERKFLVFRLGDDEYALPIENVDEVAAVPETIARVPKTPNFLEGVISLRGEVVPVVDQRRRFEMPKSETREGRRLVVVRTERHRAGLIVDSVSEVLSVPQAAIKPAPDLTGEINRLVSGVAHRARDGRLVLLLEPGELLTRAESEILDAFADKRSGLT